MRDQNAEPVSGRTVTLKTQAGREIASLVSGDNGLTRFTDRLLDGTFYQYFVDGKKLVILYLENQEVHMLMLHLKKIILPLQSLL